MIEGMFYHIYNRGANGENILLERWNDEFFLALYARSIAPVAGTYAYWLVRNHFLLLIRIFSVEERKSIWLQLSTDAPTATRSIRLALG
jgi:hypothetical protein